MEKAGAAMDGGPGNAAPGQAAWRAVVQPKITLGLVTLMWLTGWALIFLAAERRKERTMLTEYRFNILRKTTAAEVEAVENAMSRTREGQRELGELFMDMPVPSGTEMAEFRRVMSPSAQFAGMRGRVMRIETWPEDPRAFYQATMLMEALGQTGFKVVPEMAAKTAGGAGVAVSCEISDKGDVEMMDALMRSMVRLGLDIERKRPETLPGTDRIEVKRKEQDGK